MDKLLLFGETSNGGGRRGRLFLRSEAITYGSPYQRAAALVDLAEDGVGLPEQVLDKSNFASAAKFYFIFIKFHIIWTLNYFALVVLNFIEKPLWCWTNGPYSCSDRGYFFLGQLPYLTATESIIYEVVTLILLAIHTFFPIFYEGSSIFWKRPLNRLKVACFLLLVADLLVFFLYLSPVAMNSLPFRVAPYVRVILFILSIRELRTSIIILAGMSGTYLNVLALWLLFLLFASWVAYVMFEDTQQGLIFHMQNAGFLNKEQCIHLFEELHKYRSLPKISREEFELIFDELDDSRDFKINLDEFTDLCSAIGLRFQKEETLDIENNSGQKVWQKIEFVFGWIYVLEMALKVYSFGFANYWRDGQNQFDFLITWIIVIGETITFATPHGPSSFSNGEWIRYLLLARMLRLIRLLMHVQSYRAFVATFLTLIPSLMPYLGTIFCVLCIYCSIGVQFFGGLVNAGNKSLAATELTDNEGMLGYLSVAIACFKLNYFAVTSLDKISYLLFNFNDYPNGMVTLFNLLVMGNWQVWMQVVAFVLEAFFTEMNLETSGTGDEDDDHKGAGSSNGRRRLARTKGRSQRVDILLHRMLSAELDKNHSSPSSNA
ncbi:hypothetical protein V6N11_074923 [Hibiscus sabdariffa]|uniref:EF-hand domain-containing protein n=1 Tax=Hibiscus sabdariffa TaxID=183260 RepID=A0ABR2R5G3_9ROSI